MELDLIAFRERIYIAKQKGRRVYLCGNGGSAANAMHIANDWLAVGVRAIALTNLSSITAIANDFGYEYIFSRQLSVYAEQNDLLVVLTGGGKSENIIEAVMTAHNLGVASYAITGGVRVLGVVLNYILTPPNMQFSEEAQLGIGHYVAEYIKTRID